MFFETKTFRQGAIGALLDEYERALLDLRKVLEEITDADLPIVLDHQTADMNCKSIQTILTHVVHAGYGYAYSIHNRKEQTLKRPQKTAHLTVKEYLQDLDGVFQFTLTVFQTVQESEMEQHKNALKILTSWGQRYDIDQLMEHAIVHILRHRRQIEKFKILLNEMHRK